MTADQCVNGLTQAQIDKLTAMGVKESRIQEMCQDPALNPTSLDAVLNSGIPDSIIRRLFDNNQASNVVNNWPGIMAGLATTGQLPAGVTPYYPEEADVFKMLGLTDQDLQFMPPRNLKEKAEAYAEEEMQKGLDGAIPLATGLAMTYLNLAILAIMSPLLLIPCKSRASVILYVAVSVAFLIVEVSLWGKYSETVDRIMALKGGAPAEIKGLESDGKKAVEETKALGTQAATNAQTQCGPLMKSGASAQAIADCLQKAANVDSSKAEGAWKKVGKELVDQVKMIEYARELLDTVHTIFKTKAYNATLTAGVGYTAAATVAGLESMEIVTLGACIVDNNSMKDPKNKIAAFFSLINEAYAVDVKAELKKMGIDAVGPAIGVGIGFLAAIVTTIVFAIPGVKATGVARAIFFGIAAGIGYAAGILLFNGASLIKHYIEQFDILIRAMKKSMSNEGATFDESEWSPPSGYLPPKPINDELKWQTLTQKLFALFNIDPAWAAPAGQAQCFAGGAFDQIRPDPNCHCQKQGSCYTTPTIPIQLPKGVSGNHVQHTTRALGVIASATREVGRGNLQAYENEIRRLEKSKELVNREHASIKDSAINFHQNVDANPKGRKSAVPPIPNEAQMKAQIEKIVQDKVNELPANEKSKLLERLGGKVDMPAAVASSVQKDKSRVKRILDRFEDFRKGLGKYNRDIRGTQQITSGDHDPVPESQQGLDLSFKVGDQKEFDNNIADDGQRELEDYDIELNDITQDPSTSIFGLISKRYMFYVPELTK